MELGPMNSPEPPEPTPAEHAPGYTALGSRRREPMARSIHTWAEGRLQMTGEYRYMPESEKIRLGYKPPLPPPPPGNPGYISVRGSPREPFPPHWTRYMLGGWLASGAGLLLWYLLTLS